MINPLSWNCTHLGIRCHEVAAEEGWALSSWRTVAVCCIVCCSMLQCTLQSKFGFKKEVFSTHHLTRSASCQLLSAQCRAARSDVSVKTQCVMKQCVMRLGHSWVTHSRVAWHIASWHAAVCTPRKIFKMTESCTASKIFLNWILLNNLFFWSSVLSVWSTN